MELLAERIGAAGVCPGVPQASASMFKLYWSLYHQDASELALDLLGASATVPAGTWPVTWGPDVGPSALLGPPAAGLDGDTGAWIGSSQIAPMRPDCNGTMIHLGILN
jgi:hypothetical protein